MSLSDHAETEMPKKDDIWIAQEQIDLEKARIGEINALSNALGRLNESIGTLPFNQEHASEIDKARFAIAKKLQQLAG